MKRLIPLILVLVFCLWSSLEAGQIYQWIDNNGVRHFTNEPPPPGAKIVNEQAAIPYNEAADQKSAQENQEVLDQVLQQQESQSEPQAGSQPETQVPQAPPVVQTDASDSNDADQGVIVDPYVRDRERARQYERRRQEGEQIVTPLPSRNRMRERMR
jgi:FtsZ-interacting cell division protein ZipA